MDLHAQHLIGRGTSRAGSDSFRGIDPRSGEALEPAYADATPEEVHRALELAASAFEAMEEVDRETRATFLEAIAQNLLDLGDPLIDRTSAETALPEARLQGERGRTVGQLRLFAQVVREGSYLGARLDLAQPDRQPLPKPDVRRMLVPLGPVAIFGASNFPLAFSVAGGDTASALAAGCPVVAKGHPSHPGASELVARAIIDAAETTGLPEGVFSLVHGAGHAVGLELVRHPLTTAVGFTGSLRGGRALFDAAAARDVPIPVYAEMGSTNPLFLLPGALADGAEAIATGLHGSVNLGVGQFCTNPGLVIVQDGPDADTFLEHLTAAFAGGAGGSMLNEGIRRAYDAGSEGLGAIPGVEALARSAAGPGPCGATPALFVTDAATFQKNAQLRHEVFGPATLVVRCPDVEAILTLARSLDGQLTAGLHATEADAPLAARLVKILHHKAGRVLYGGYPTGVEVCPSMQHGGPYPSTTDTRTTSVGTAAIDRWLRPVAYQSFPQNQLPPELRDGNPTGIWRMVDGEWGQH